MKPEDIAGGTLHVHVIGRIWMPGVMAQMHYTFRVDPVNTTDIWTEGGIPANVLLADPKNAIDDYLVTHSGDFQTVEAWHAYVNWSEPCTFADGTKGAGQRTKHWETDNFEEMACEVISDEDV